MSEPTRESRLDEAIAAYYQAVESGQVPDRDAFLSQYPELSTELKAFLDDKAAFERRAGTPHSPDETATLPPRDSLAGAAGSERRIRYFGDYELLEEIARGGMGVVFKARQVSLNRIVAVKMILAGNLATPADVQRFRAEAEAAANLDHPNILPIYEVGEHEGQHYFSMKWVDGGSLAERLATLRRSVSDTPQIRALVAELIKVARAVNFAHQRGIIHRDLKPSNILLDREHAPYVTDFGLAKRVEGDSGLTQSGAIVGTPSYMAPEQARAEKQLSTSVDVYSLGAILFQCLTGRPPFQGPTQLDTMMAVLEREPEWPANCDRDLATIAMKCLEKEPGKRYASAETLAEDLERWVRSEPVFARRIGPGIRTWKWVKRRPTLASLVLFGLAATIAGVVGTWVFVSRLQQRELIERRYLYAANSDLLQAAWNDRRIDRVVELLESMKPQGNQSDLRGFEWYYFARLSRPELGSFQRPAVERPIGVAFSPNAALFATAYSGGIQIWDTSTGQKRCEINTLTWQSSIAFSPDSRRLVGAGANNTARIWDVKTSKELNVFKLDSVCTHTAFSQNGRLLATADGVISTVRIWDAVDGKELHRFQRPGQIKGLAFSPDGTRLLTSSIVNENRVTSGTTAVWDVETWRQMFTVKHSGSVDGVAFRPNQLQFATVERNSPTNPAASDEKWTTRVWDAKTGHEHLTLEHTGRHVVIAFCPTATRVATAECPTAENCVIRILDANTLGVQRSFQVAGRVVGMTFSFDGSRLKTIATSEGNAFSAGIWTHREWAVVGDASVFRLGGPVTHSLEKTLDLLKDNTLDVWRTNSPFLPSVAFDTEGMHLATATAPGLIEIWNCGSGTSVRAFQDSSELVESVGFTPDSSHLTTLSLTSGGSARIWNLKTGRSIESLKRDPQYLGVACGASGLRMARVEPAGQKSLEEPTRISSWDVETGQELASLSGTGRVMTRGALGPDGFHFATSILCPDDDQFPIRFVVVDLSTGRQILAQKHKVVVNAVAFSPNCKRLVAVPEDDTPIVLDLETGNVLFALKGHNGHVNAVAFSPDNSRIATVCDDKSVRIWDAFTGQQLLSLAGHTGPVLGVAFSPDGERLATISADGTARIWDGRPLK
jgi:WD40 repeat protein